jgi:hypothetical protein
VSNIAYEDVPQDAAKLAVLWLLHNCHVEPAQLVEGVPPPHEANISPENHAAAIEWLQSYFACHNVPVCETRTGIN